ncbi:MAG: hypothetical protein U9N73_00505 [Candidatus Auribacterota bacterium]|nr:hypothetical protein [Candidatus Auribacterota bacterium]
MVSCDPTTIERQIRQTLCNKISGNYSGIWLLIPEHLRLGTWDLLRGWTGKQTTEVEPRVALQLVHEAALCVTGKRQTRTLSHQGFEVANGLPFVASDVSVHNLLNAHTVAEAQSLQLMLGKIRHALGHYPGKVLTIDPHRIPSYSKRQMVHKRKSSNSPAIKQLQTFFSFDADSQQPICFTIGSSSRTVSQATPGLLKITADILSPLKNSPLVLADTEHYSYELLEDIRKNFPFDLLVPMPKFKGNVEDLQKLRPDIFTRHWTGYATAQRIFYAKRNAGGPYCQIVQRFGERDDDIRLNAFLCTSTRAVVDNPVQQYPKRWHCEEFYNANQDLGWQRSGTLNLHIRYGHMTTALIAQAVIHMLRQRVGQPIANWDAKHLAQDFFHDLEGDIRIKRDTIIVTYYNAPNVDLLRRHYTNLPEKLARQGVNPTIPWLFNYKLDFRFR